MTPADTNVADILLWVVALSTFFSFGSLIWTVFSGPSRKNGARIETLETGKPKTVEAGSQIVPGYVLKEVHSDHVLVTRDGAVERLKLDRHATVKN